MRETANAFFTTTLTAWLFIFKDPYKNYGSTWRSLCRPDLKLPLYLQK